MKYTYTAVFAPMEGGTEYFARVPDLPGCATTGDDLDDAIDQITDAASVWLVGAEDIGLPIAPPTPQENIAHDPAAVLSLIHVDTIAYRDRTDERIVSG